MRPIPVDTRKGEQHKPEYLAINPNAKVPASSTATRRCSTAMRSCSISPRRPANSCPRHAQGAWRTAFVADVRRFRRRSLCRPVGAFRSYAPEKIPYAINRYAFEAQRHFGILDARLAKQKYMLGEVYTIVDMAVWGWARALPIVLGESRLGEIPEFEAACRRDQRPAGGPAGRALKDKHKFKTEMDDVARKAMFPHMSEKVA